MIDIVLIEKIVNFQKITGKNASAIYLGRNEVLRLKEWASFAYQQTFKMSHSPEFYGIKVYEMTVPM